MQFYVYINSDSSAYGDLNPNDNLGATTLGNVTIDNIREVSPTWATAGSGSWTAADPATGSWIGGSLPGGAVGGTSAQRDAGGSRNGQLHDDA